MQLSLTGIQHIDETFRIPRCRAEFLELLFDAQTSAGGIATFVGIVAEATLDLAETGAKQVLPLAQTGDGNVVFPCRAAFLLGADDRGSLVGSCGDETRPRGIERRFGVHQSGGGVGCSRLCTRERLGADVRETDAHRQGRETIAVACYGRDERIAEGGIHGRVEGFGVRHPRKQDVEQVVERRLMGTGTGPNVVAEFARGIGRCSTQRIERQDGTRVLRRAQVIQGGAGVRGVVDDDGGERLPERRLHRCAPIRIDVDQVEKGADASGDLAQRLHAQRLCIDRGLQRLHPRRRGCGRTGSCGVGVHRIVERTLGPGGTGLHREELGGGTTLRRSRDEVAEFPLNLLDLVS